MINMAVWLQLIFDKIPKYQISYFKSLDTSLIMDGPPSAIDT